MKSRSVTTMATALPVLVGLTAMVLLMTWAGSGSPEPLEERRPAPQDGGVAATSGPANAGALGKLVRGAGIAAKLPGDWPGFRGRERDGIAHDSARLARVWSQDGPRMLWSIPVGEGYAGPAVQHGRVYLIDYDDKAHADAVRCLSLADGRDIWQYAYPVKIKRNHGFSRTVPAVSDRFVVTLGPLCHLVCLDASDGRLIWARDLVADFGVTVPEWYAGQCPLIDGDRLIIATGGKALLVALDMATGQVVWESPNPRQWKMTHGSIATAQIDGTRMYVYCGSGGVAGVAAESGQLLWDTTEWRISIATIATPVVIAVAGSERSPASGRVFLSGGYGAGSMMMEVLRTEQAWSARSLFRTGPQVFGATQQTPIFHQGHLWGVRPDGRLACLRVDGSPVWDSGPGTNFGLGPSLLADGLIFVMDDNGRLTMAEASTQSYRPLASAKVLDGPESWGPMALVGDRLLVRDAKHLACLAVGESEP